jgi:hypothetical protein
VPAFSKSTISLASLAVSILFCGTYRNVNQGGFYNFDRVSFGLLNVHAFVYNTKAAFIYNGGDFIALMNDLWKENPLAIEPYFKEPSRQLLVQAFKWHFSIVLTINNKKQIT